MNKINNVILNGTRNGTHTFFYYTASDILNITYVSTNNAIYGVTWYVTSNNIEYVLNDICYEQD